MPSTAAASLTVIVNRSEPNRGATSMIGSDARRVSDPLGVAAAVRVVKWRGDRGHEFELCGVIASPSSGGMGEAARRCESRVGLHGGSFGRWGSQPFSETKLPTKLPTQCLFAHWPLQTLLFLPKECRFRSRARECAPFALRRNSLAVVLALPPPPRRRSLPTAFRSSFPS